MGKDDGKSWRPSATGRGAKQYLKDIADTITEARAEKHAFASGIAARKGGEW
ncbi:cob(I)yrinic acid a,c-diamide adenosyltransferase [Microbulbifer sp.]|uniref:cob(I)yrinic acid a,c-diamide adenosyltransferase n=1 Tax=Microbulbifer sp. TaxID=1908541 RepID=UPI003F398A85